MNPCSIAICCSSLFGHSQLCLIAVWLCRLAVFENYQKARASFVQTVADLSSRPQNVDALREAGVMALLRPLLIDTVPTIQQVPPPCARTSTPQKNKTKAQAAPPPSTALKARKLWRRVVPCLSPSHTHAHAHTHSHPHAHTHMHTHALARASPPPLSQTAALALGRLANHSDELAAAVVHDDILPQLVYSLAEQNRSDEHPDALPFPRHTRTRIRTHTHTHTRRNTATHTHTQTHSHTNTLCCDPSCPKTKVLSRHHHQLTRLPWFHCTACPEDFTRRRQPLCCEP